MLQSPDGQPFSYRPQVEAIVTDHFPTLYEK